MAHYRSLRPRCRHCYIYALGSHAKFKEMDLADMVTIIENCKTFCEKAGRLPYLYITGGDPILHPQFWTLMKILNLSDIPFALMGNPFHLTADVCRRLKEYGCKNTSFPWTGSEKPTTASASSPAPTMPPWPPSLFSAAPEST